MPTKEKDKLLLRLVAKDSTLVDRLHFELIEEGTTLEERRDEIRSRIDRTAARRHDTPGWLMMDMRDLSGAISYHVKITKDKSAALDLNLYLLLTIMEAQQDLLKTYSSRADTCALYLAKKANTVLTAFNRLQDDYRFDYLSDINRMLEWIYALCSKMYARQIGLPQNIEN